MSETTAAVIAGTVTFTGLASWGLIARWVGCLARRAWAGLASQDSGLPHFMEEGIVRVALESTSKVVEVVIDGTPVPGRVWEGRTDFGIEVAALIMRIAVRREEDQSRFEAELHACPDVRSEGAGEAFPLRMIL